MRKAAPHPAERVADELLETVPVLMRTLRAQLRLASPEGLSVPQFHALVFLRRHPGAGLSEVASYVGVTLPTMSELVNRLVAAGYVLRTRNPSEGRRVCLAVTTEGEALIDGTMSGTRAKLVDLFAARDPERLSGVVAALGELRDALGGIAGKDD